MKSVSGDGEAGVGCIRRTSDLRDTILKYNSIIDTMHWHSAYSTVLRSNACLPLGKSILQLPAELFEKPTSLVLRAKHEIAAKSKTQRNDQHLNPVKFCQILQHSYDNAVGFTSKGRFVRLLYPM